MVHNNLPMEELEKKHDMNAFLKSHPNLGGVTTYITKSSGKRYYFCVYKKHIFFLCNSAFYSSRRKRISLSYKAIWQARQCKKKTLHSFASSISHTFIFVLVLSIPFSSLTLFSSYFSLARVYVWYLF